MRFTKRLKSVLFIVFLSVLGLIMSSYFSGVVLLTQLTPLGPAIKPPSTSSSPRAVNSDAPLTPFSTLGQPGDVIEPTIVTPEGSTGVSFIHGEIQTGWIPWIIKQVSILVGGLSLIVFAYAGVNLIIHGDSEEELSKSIRIIIYGIVGIALAAFSYTIIANVLLLL